MGANTVQCFQKGTALVAIPFFKFNRNENKVDFTSNYVGFCSVLRLGVEWLYTGCFTTLGHNCRR